MRISASSFGVMNAHGSGCLDFVCVDISAPHEFRRLRIRTVNVSWRVLSNESANVACTPYCDTRSDFCAGGEPAFLNALPPSRGANRNRSFRSQDVFQPNEAMGREVMFVICAQLVAPCFETSATLSEADRRNRMTCLGIFGVGQTKPRGGLSPGLP